MLGLALSAVQSLPLCSCSSNNALPSTGIIVILDGVEYTGSVIRLSELRDYEDTFYYCYYFYNC